MSGFSQQNLRSIRYWYQFYHNCSNDLQAVSKLKTIENMVKSIPWGHNQRIMYKCKSIDEALFMCKKQWTTIGAEVF